MKTRSFKRVLSLLLLLILCLTALSSVAYADDVLIDTSKIDCSITVTKYATTNNSIPGNAATGMNGQTIPSGYTTLNDAKFMLFKIADAAAVKDYYDGTTTTTYDLAQFSYDDATGTATYNGSAIAAGNTWTGVTAGSGTYTFNNLPVGIYVLKEITAPSQITTPLAETSLISIPMVNTATSANNGNAKWIYDVYVYPKNHEATGTVELTKVDQNGTSLNGVTFKLSKKEFQSDGTLPSTGWVDVDRTINNSGVTTYLTLTTGADGKITLANLPAGLYGTQYMLVEQSAPNGYIVNQTPLYFRVTKNNTIEWNSTSGDPTGLNNTNTGVTATSITADPKLSITLRNELPEMTKRVFVNGTAYSDATNLTANWKQDEQYRLDDTITYSLIAYVPNNVSEITYEITDLPDSGITDSQTWTDYTVTYADSKAALTDGTADTKLTLTTDYTLSAYSNSGYGQGFKLELTADGKTATKGKFIQIVYKAHMNANAVIADVGNGNTATLTYSKYINGADDKYTIKDEARVYTYQYKITKYKDSATAGNEIGNVEFQLLDEYGNQLKVIKLADGEYRLAIAGDTLPTDPYTMVTKSDGTILIKGLENGTYYLKETKTIDNYNLLSEPFMITVNVTETTSWTPGSGFTATGEVVKSYGSTGYSAYGGVDPTGTSTIINKKGFVLPQTGGLGFLLFSAAGIVLVAGGALLLFGGRKKKIR